MSEPTEEPRAVASTRAVDIVVSLLLAAFAALMAWDNWKSGAGWASDGPKSGYFPFYLALLLGDPRPQWRRRAIEELANRGPAALKAIEPILSNPSSPANSALSAVWAACHCSMVPIGSQ